MMVDSADITSVELFSRKIFLMPLYLPGCNIYSQTHLLHQQISEVMEIFLGYTNTYIKNAFGARIEDGRKYFQNGKQTHKNTIIGMRITQKKKKEAWGNQIVQTNRIH